MRVRGTAQASVSKTEQRERQTRRGWNELFGVEDRLVEVGRRGHELSLHPANTPVLGQGHLYTEVLDGVSPEATETGWWRGPCRLRLAATPRSLWSNCG